MFDPSRNQNVKAIIILGLLIFASYLPITMLGHTANTSLNLARVPVLDFARDYGCIKDCGGPYNFTIDPGADGDAIWPVMRLASELYLKGIVPLWNPYLAVGTPLAADTLNFVFSPMMIFYLLPNSLWDVPLLVSVWLAGVFTYFLLRSWKLGFLSSISGSTIFMFGGAITWYLPHDSVPVVIFTPLILFSIEKIFQSKNFKYVILGGVAVAFAVLGGHLESIALLLFFSVVYAAFRMSYVVFSKYKQTDQVQTNDIVLVQNKKKTVLKIIVIFFAGLTLSAFFILPVVEYFFIGYVGRDNTIGLATSPAFTVATTFIPYLLGGIHIYVSPATNFMSSWNILGGYVVASSLLFSLLGITFSNKLFQSNLHKRIAQFFFGMSIFFIFKSIGIPVINSIGLLPILDHVVFPRYDGFIWILGFAISAAFGIEVLLQKNISKKHLVMITAVAFSVIISMSLLIIPYFTWQNLAGYYIIFQILQALFFVLMAFLIVIAYQRNNSNVSAIFLLIFLEASLYLPFGLPLLWQFYRSIAVIIGVSVLCLAAYLPIEKISRSANKDKIKLIIFLIIVASTILGEVAVYLEAPQGLLLRHNAYDETLTTKFLQNNIGDWRIFSLDAAFRPDHPAAFQVQTVGILSANNVNSFNSFFHEILDPYALVTHFDYIPSWRTANAPSLESVFLKNQRYYDFLGVKYIVTYQSNPNGFHSDGQSKYLPVGANANETIKEAFVSSSDFINSTEIWFGTYNGINHGDVILTMDSIPYDDKYHRISQVKAENMIDGGFSKFEFAPITGIKGKQMLLTIYHPQADSNNGVAISAEGIDQIKSTQDPDLANEQLYLDGNSINGTIHLAFLPYKFPLAFSDNGINIYENKNVYPRAFLVNKFQTTDSYQDAQSIINGSNFDLRNKVVLEKNLPQEQIDSLRSSNLNGSTTNIVSYVANKVLINVDSKGGSLLVLTDTYYPGWKALVDGKETTIYRADGLVRAIFIPVGSHTIEFSYMPKSFAVGVIISIVTASLLVGFYVYFRRKSVMKSKNENISYKKDV
jgi:hypothetical protein